MAKKCKDFYKNGKPCRFKALENGFCKIHQPKVIPKKNIFSGFQKYLLGLSIMTVIGFMAKINGAYSLFERFLPYFTFQEKIVCDRDKDLGCSIDISAENIIEFNEVGTVKRPVDKDIKKRAINSAKVVMTPADGKNTKEYEAFLTQFVIKSGEYYHPANFTFNPPRKSNYSRFPLIEKYGKQFAPYVVEKRCDKINFFGEINEFKTDRLLGWFNENDFGVVKPCAFSWNKDEKAIEIVDEFGQVCFFVEYKNDVIEFRGYFKYDTQYYIYNDKEYITKDEQKARRLIREIPKVFDHYRPNLGHRL